MKTLLLPLLLCCCTSFAQEIASTEFFNFGRWNDEYNTPDLDTAYIFADACKVRTEPKQDAAVITKLLIGTRVRILQVTNTKTTINGVESEWLKIQADTVTGYVWGGTITNQILQLPDDRIAAWGIVKITGKEENQKVTASIRVARDHFVTSSLDFDVTYGDAPAFGQLKLFEKPLLDSVTLCISYRTYSGACGVVASEHYLFEVNRKLMNIGFGYSNVDGGMFFTNRRLILPTKAKDGEFRSYHHTPDPNHVLVKVETGEYDEECNWIEETTIENYEWKDFKLYRFCDE